jgi:hypothetical protein
MKTMFAKLRRQLGRSVSETCRWVRSGKVIWIWFGLFIAIVWGFYVLPFTLAARVLGAGILFELLGVTAVLLGIIRMRQLFGEAPFGIWNLLKEFRFIFSPRPPITATAHMTEGSDSLDASATVVSKAANSIEEHVARIEKQVVELKTSIGNLDRKVKDQHREFLAKLHEEAVARQAGDRSVDQRLKESMVGGSSVEFAGVCYLYPGLVMANMSTEIAEKLQWLGCR